FGPRRRSRLPVPDDGAEPIVPVREDIGLDDDPLADDPLRGETPAIDLGPHGLDHRSPSSFRQAVAAVHRSAGRVHGPAPFGSCRNTTIAGGGSVTVSEWYRPCAPTGAASRPPRLPCPEPP